MSQSVTIVPAMLWSAQGVLRYTLQFAEQSPSNNEIKGMHFHAYRKARTMWMARVQQALDGVEILPPLSRSFLVVTRECAGDLDWDNIYGGLKPLLDCLVSPSKRNPSGLGLIEDDCPKNMPFPPFVRQLRGKRGEGRTTIEIYELAD